jgi:hypothetical protein
LAGSADCVGSAVRANLRACEAVGRLSVRTAWACLADRGAAGQIEDALVSLCVISINASQALSAGGACDTWVLALCSTCHTTRRVGENVPSRAAGARSSRGALRASNGASLAIHTRGDVVAGSTACAVENVLGIAVSGAVSQTSDTSTVHHYVTRNADLVTLRRAHCSPLGTINTQGTIGYRAIKGTFGGGWVPNI